MAGEYALAVCCFLSAVIATTYFYKWFQDWLLYPEEWNDYLRTRSPILFVITMASLYSILTFERGSSLIIFALNIQLWNPLIEHSFSLVMISFLLLLHLLRCWKLLVSRMVIIRINGLNWKSMLDPSLMDNNNLYQSFWLNWKSTVQSDELNMNLFLLLFCLLCGSYALLAYYTQSSLILLIYSLSLLLFISFLSLIICFILTPKGSKFFIKEELNYQSMILSCMLSLQLLALITSKMPEHQSWNIMIRQFIWQCGWFVYFFISVVFIPYKQHCILNKNNNNQNRLFFGSFRNVFSCLLFYMNGYSLPKNVKSHSNSSKEDDTTANDDAAKTKQSDTSVSTISRKNSKRMVSSKQLNPLLKECLIDSEVLSGFMNHACECFSAENLLMLIEVFLFKRQLRKKIKKLLKKYSKRRSISHSSHSVSFGSALSGAIDPPAMSINLLYPNNNNKSSKNNHNHNNNSDDNSATRTGTRTKTRSRTHSDSLPDVELGLVGRGGTMSGNDDEDVEFLNCETHKIVRVFNNAKQLNDELFRAALEHEWFESAIRHTGWIGKRHSRWDLSLNLVACLDELGVRSAIVSDHEKNAYQKAYAIYAKYIANGSKLQVNIGGFTRQTQTSIFQSTVDDDDLGFEVPAYLPQLGLCDLLFVFDEVMMDVFVNLEDTCVRYKAQIS